MPDQTLIATAFGVPNQTPWPSWLRSRYGTAASTIRKTVGTMTPASAGFMCSSSSCRLRKYHGALDGFGVTSALARLISGAFTTRRDHREAEGEQDGADELDEYEIRPDEELLLAFASRSYLGLGWRRSSQCSPLRFSLERPRHAAVAADAPEVYGHEDRRD